ncbi:transporter [Cellulophaga baltica]|nr:transporter [Cellulophaga baltica]
MKDLKNFNKKILVLIIMLLGFAVVKANDKQFNTIPEPCENHYHILGFDDDFCDTCGCGSSGGSMGYGTGLNDNFIGIRYIHQQYRSRDGIFNDSPWIKENFNTIQAWGNIPVSDRLLINTIVPFQFHNRIFPDNTEQHISGLGDVSILAFYNVLKVKPDSIVSIKPEHYLQIGGGLKLPTGSYDQENNEGSVNPSFQLGNGSLDYVLGLNYGFSYRNWGISTMLNYAIKTENPDNYQFGNQFNYSINAYKTYYLSNSFSVTPIAGLAGEVYGENQEYNLPVADTKGDLFLGKLSLEASLNNYSLGVVAMAPISQNLNGNKVELKNRTSIYLNINF